jgi:uncharacterized repeat protein (TIGR01451 family)
VLTGTHVVTAVEAQAGQVVNTASANSTEIPGPTPSNTVTTPVVQIPAFTLVKSDATLATDADGSGDVTEGDTLSYTITLTNTGDTALTAVVVTDAQLTPGSESCPTVAVGGSCILTGTHVVTAAEAQVGEVVNTASVTSTEIPSPTPSNTVITPVVQVPAFTLVKSDATLATDADGSGDVTEGDTLSYTVTLTNTGDVALTNVDVLDAQLTPGSQNCPTVAVGGTCVLTGTHVVTAVEAQAGQVVNTASANSTEIPGPTPSNTVITPVVQIPAFTLIKSDATLTADADGSGDVTEGDTLSYTITLTNTGDTALSAVVVTDAQLTPGSETCPTVAVAGTCVLTGTHVVTAAEAQAGQVVNTASATTTEIPGPTPSNTVITPVVQVPAFTLIKSDATLATDADGSGDVTEGDTLSYTVTLANTGDTALTAVVVTDAQLTPGSETCPTVAVGGACVLTGTHVVTAAEAQAGQVVNTASATSAEIPGPTPSNTVITPVLQMPAIAVTKSAELTTDLGVPGRADTGDVITYSVSVTNTGNMTLTNVIVEDSFQGGAPVALSCAPTTLAPGQAATCATYTHTVTAQEANAGAPLVNAVVATGTTQSGGQTVTVTADAEAAVEVQADPAVIRLTKTVQPFEVRIGDLVRYQLVIENTGNSPVVDGLLVDTPPAGFTYVMDSLEVADRDGGGRLVGTYPIRVDRIDVDPGQRATISYLLRVGAGVRPGIHTNSAMVSAGDVQSNLATASVRLAGDPLLDESLVIGTVFDDRDGDGHQDLAVLTGVRVQGGFDPGAYVAGSTRIVRDGAPSPVPDASAPLLRGVDLGDIGGRQSEGDPAAVRQVLVSQLLSEPRFTGDFLLTSEQGISLRMDADGKTRVEQGDELPAGSSAMASVERRIARESEGYRVDYVVANTGIEERGIPGVRIASVEGLLVETDPFGRYHLVGVEGGPWERGRNFVLKVDPATLPPGSVPTTANPLVRRVTPGIPVRFDFGFKLPSGRIAGGSDTVELALGSVLFAAGSAELRPGHEPVIASIVSKIREHGAGELVITADGEGEALAFARARAMQEALQLAMPDGLADEVAISLRSRVSDPDNAAALVAGTPVLGTVLFDTDQAMVKPAYGALLDAVAADIKRRAANPDGMLTIGIVGHADHRGSDQYNLVLGLRRAKAVFEALEKRLEPALRERLRVEISDDPDTPVRNIDGGL